MSGDGVVIDDDEEGAEVRQRQPFAMTPKKLLRDPEISVRAKALYGVLGTYANGGVNNAYPGRKTVAKHLACSVDSLDRALAELEKGHWVRVRRRVNNSSIYHLRRMYEDDDEDDLVAAPMRGGRTHAATQGGRTRAAGVAAPVRPNQEPSDQEPTTPPTPPAGGLEVESSSVAALLPLAESLFENHGGDSEMFAHQAVAAARSHSAGGALLDACRKVLVARSVDPTTFDREVAGV